MPGLLSGIIPIRYIIGSEGHASDKVYHDRFGNPAKQTEACSLGRGSLFYEFNLLPELPNLLLKLSDSLFGDFIAIAGRSAPLQGTFAESFLAVILVFDVMGDSPDSLLAKYVCWISVLIKDLAGDFSFLVLLPEELLEFLCEVQSGRRD